MPQVGKMFLILASLPLPLLPKQQHHIRKKGYGLMDDPAADLMFTINSDGTLQATGKLQGMYSTMSAFYVDLSKAALSPAE